MSMNPDASPARVLVVDDEERFAQNVVEYFTLSDLPTTYATTIPEARTALAQ